jgi:hypothetical protein
MSATKTARRPFTKLLSLALLAFLATSLNACLSGDENPMGPSAEAGPEAETSYYQVKVDLSHFKVVNDCDKDPRFGDPNPGEFDYTIEVWAVNHTGRHALVKELTGSFTKRGGQTYQIDRLVEFRVKNGDNYYVGVKATERDGAFNDDDYVGYEQDVNKAGGQLYYDHKLVIGSGGCKMEFHYTAEEIPIF